MKRIVMKAVSNLMAAVLMLTCVCMVGCSENQMLQEKQISFEYTLTQKEGEKVLADIAKLEEYIDGGKNRKIITAEKALEDPIDYISHQYSVGRIKYYSDLANEEYSRMFVQSEEIYMQVREEYLRVLKKLYSSDLKAKERVFEDWTESQIEVVEVSGPEVIELEKQQQELMRQYLALENPESPQWSAALEEIYLQFVDVSKRYAAVYGYDNYYDYSDSEIYLRCYTEEQRDNFRKNIKEYILPFFVKMDDIYNAKREQLTDKQTEQYKNFINDICLPTNEYFAGYVDSYPEKMQRTMIGMYEKSATVYTEAENAFQTAFTDYSDYYDQPYVFFGRDCQDIFTVVHEMGHYVSLHHFDNSSLPYDTCEVHSQGNEWLMLYYLAGKIDKDVYDTVLLRRLTDGLATVIVSTVVDEYEEAVYTRNVTEAEELKIIMGEILDGYKYIEKVVDRDYMYIYAQYVTMEAPVYYLSYATSELAAVTLYSTAVNSGYEKAQEIYTNLCLETPTDNTMSDTLADVGLPNPFEFSTASDITALFSEMFVLEYDLAA